MTEFNDWNARVIDEFRANGGKVEAFPANNLILLHHTGAKSGQERVTPLAYQPVDGGYAIFASKAGAPENPAWYYNLRANPLVEVRDGTQTGDYTARLVDGPERDEWWERAVAAFPNYAEYQEKTDRTIPVFVLERVQ